MATLSRHVEQGSAFHHYLAVGVDKGKENPAFPSDRTVSDRNTSWLRLDRTVDCGLNVERTDWENQISLLISLAHGSIRAPIKAPKGFRREAFSRDN